MAADPRGNWHFIAALQVLNANLGFLLAQDFKQLIHRTHQLSFNTRVNTRVRSKCLLKYLHISLLAVCYVHSKNPKE